MQYFTGMKFTNETETMADIKKNLESLKQSILVTREEIHEMKGINEFLANTCNKQMNVVIDISGVLRKYNDFLSMISAQVQDINKISATPVINPKDLEALQQATEEQLKKVSQYFQNDFAKVIEVLKENKVSDHSMNQLKTAYDDFAKKGRGGATRKTKNLKRKDIKI